MATTTDAADLSRGGDYHPAMSDAGSTVGCAYLPDLADGSKFGATRDVPVMTPWAVEFAATDADRPATEAFGFLKTIEGQKRPDMSQAPQAFLTPAWKRVVIDSEGRIDRQFYTFCTLERLQDGLKRRDLFVTASRRWGDPYAKLLKGPAWEKARALVCRTLGRSPTAAEELEGLGKQLDEAYRRATNNLPTNSAVTDVPPDSWTVACETLDTMEPVTRSSDP